MPDANEPKDLSVRPDPPLSPTSIQLGSKQRLDLSALSPEARDALVVKHGELEIERDNRRETLRDDLTATTAKMATYAKTAVASAGEGMAVTITNTHDDSLGRTEIIVGNTDAAQKGKLTRSQTGHGDNTKVWIIIAIIAGAVIVLVALFIKR